VFLQKCIDQWGDAGRFCVKCSHLSLWPLDLDLTSHIRVSIVCTSTLVSTWYALINYSSSWLNYI
jgi:hypothetical protein